jgi:hypothetical protein
MERGPGDVYDLGEIPGPEDFFGLADKPTASAVALARMFGKEGSGLLRDPESLLSHRLSYVDNQLKVKGGKRLAELIIQDRGEALPNLRSLDLSNCNLNADAAEKLSGMLTRQPELRQVSLPNNQFCGKHNGLLGWQGDYSAANFGKLVAALPPLLVELDLSENCIQSQGAYILAEYPLNRLEVLRLASNQLCDRFFHNDQGSTAGLTHLLQQIPTTGEWAPV